MSNCPESTTTQRGRINRRGMLQVGGLTSLGITLPQLLRAEDTARPNANNGVAAKPDPAKRTPAKSCILFFLEGGPSHIDLWDMKPDAPEQVRGIYQPIATSLPGMHVCEHLPQWARQMHHMSVVRSVTHKIVDHNASTYFMLTGQTPFRDGQLIRGPSRQNVPPFGSVLAKLRPSGQPLPDYVHLPKRMFNCGNFIPGVLAGFLGDMYDPFVAGDPSVPDYKVPGLDMHLANARFDRRKSLLKQIDRGLGPLSDNPALDRMDTFYQKAYSLITSPLARKAFDLRQEPDSIRRRYGLGFKRAGGARSGGGLPHLGQSMLLARRLVEAGVRLVAIWVGGQAFDTHRNHFPTLTKSLCPHTDQSFSALLEDLSERGLLDETLVVALSEFGRTPKLGQITSSAGATPDGRDHWPHCYTAFLAGAGIKAGQVYGASDGLGGYPVENPVTPQDVAATIYTAMGIDPHTRIYDSYHRPHTLADGTPIAAIMT